MNEKRDVIENLALNSYFYGQMSFGKSAKTIQRREDNIFNK
jgi:hypothetical protein